VVAARVPVTMPDCGASNASNTSYGALRTGAPIARQTDANSRNHVVGNRRGLSQLRHGRPPAAESLLKNGAFEGGARYWFLANFAVEAPRLERVTTEVK